MSASPLLPQTKLLPRQQRCSVTSAASSLPVYFLEKAQQYQSVFVDRNLFQASLELFSSLKKRGTSFVDCSNAAVMRALGIPFIFSFNRGYDALGVQRFAIFD
ncbi:MAG: hypothetical protein H6774_01900 [Pseudomonadales bacterium]|nr:hypothetical protein [Candidatus Woesebacteria bacterium]MCB9801819.1 hypothetical protein [Pseudomonadales bacterium]